MDLDLKGAEEVQANWFKFLKVGDGIKGTLVGKSLNKGVVPYPDQWVYELKNEDGVFNVPVSVNKKGTIQRLNNVPFGEIIAIVFDKEGEESQKGFAKAKYLKVYSFGMDETFTNDEPEVAADGEEEIKVEEAF